MTTQTAKRRDRYKKTPVLNPDGTKRTRNVSSQDEEILRLLASGYDARRPWAYSMLRNKYISALLKRDHSWTCEATNFLARSRYLYLPDQPEFWSSQLIYALDEKGADYVDQPKPRHERSMRHELMTNDIAASFELTAQKHNLEIIPWPEIFSSDQFPQNTYVKKDPAAIPVGNSFIRADWKPFVFRTPSRFYFMPGFEADAASKPVRRSVSIDQTSLSLQLDHYLTFLAEKTYWTHFGAKLSSIFIPFILMKKPDEPERLQNVMSELDRLVKTKGYPRSFAKHFGFKEVPAFLKKPMPASDWTASGWKRAGYEDFSFVEKEEAGVEEV